MRADLRALCLELSRNGITAAELYQLRSGQPGAPSLRTCRQVLVTLTEEGALHAHGGNVKVYFLSEDLPRRLQGWRTQLQARLTQVLGEIGTWADFARLRQALAERPGGYSGDPTLLSDVLRDLPGVERQTVRLRRDEITRYRLPPPDGRPALDPALIRRADEAARTLLDPDGPQRFSGVAFRKALGVAREVAERLLMHLTEGGRIRAIEGCLIATFEAAPRRPRRPRLLQPRRRSARILSRPPRVRLQQRMPLRPAAEGTPSSTKHRRNDLPQPTGRGPADTRRPAGERLPGPGSHLCHSQRPRRTGPTDGPAPSLVLARASSSRAGVEPRPGRLPAQSLGEQTRGPPGRSRLPRGTPPHPRACPPTSPAPSRGAPCPLKPANAPNSACTSSSRVPLSP